MGGLFYGICFGLPILRRLGSPGFFGKEGEPRCSPKRIVGALIGVALLVTSVILLWQGDHPISICKKCRFLSCVPFPLWDVEKKWWYCDGCDNVAADILYANGTSFLEIACPYGDIATIDLMDTDPNTTVLREDLDGYCRGSCAL